MKRIKYKNIGEETINNPYQPLFGKKTHVSRFVVSSDVFQIDGVKYLVVIDNQDVTFELVRESDGVTVFKQEGIKNHVVIRRKVKEELEKRGISFAKEKREHKPGRLIKNKRSSDESHSE